jgi:chaperonin GroEL
MESENIQRLVIVASSVSDKAQALLHFVNVRSKAIRVIAVKPLEKGDTTTRSSALDDLALLTGGRMFLEAVGDSYEQLAADDLGYARWVWADRSFFGIIHGKGDPRAVRARIQALTELYFHQTDATQRRLTLLRLGRLRGGTVTLLVGGMTESDIEQRETETKRAVEALRLAAREGIVPGGGMAFLNCQDVLRQRAASADPDERAAYSILIDTMEAPLRTMVANAGHEWSRVAAQLRQAGDGMGCDMRTGELVDMRAAGICDIARVTKEAVWRAVKGAALALTTDTLIHKRNPDQKMRPR